MSIEDTGYMNFPEWCPGCGDDGPEGHFELKYCWRHSKNDVGSEDVSVDPLMAYETNDPESRWAARNREWCEWVNRETEKKTRRRRRL